MLKLKKSKIPLFVAAMVTSCTTLAFENPQSEKPNHSEMAELASSFLTTAITSVADKLIAVGDRGHVFVNSAQVWQQVTVPSTALLTNVSFADKNHGWAVGHDATILHTSDGGSRWELQQVLPELDRPLLGVAFSDANTGVAVGAYGMYFSTRDGGQTWTNQFLDSLLPKEDVEYLAEIRAESEEEYQFEISSILPHFNSIVYLSDGRLLLVGELGLVAFSSDGGKSWQRQADIYEGSFFTSLESDKGSLLVAGLRGNMFRSTDAGASWQQVVLNNKLNINHLIQLKNGDIYASQNNGVVLKSSDDGVSFSQVLLSKGQDMMSVAQINQQIWLAGSKGLSKFQAK